MDTTAANISPRNTKKNERNRNRIKRRRYYNGDSLYFFVLALEKNLQQRSNQESNIFAVYFTFIPDHQTNSNDQPTKICFQYNLQLFRFIE